MIHHQILAEPASTKRVMANLSLAIDEAILTRRIVALSDNLQRIENMPEQSNRTQFLRQELIILEDSLNDIRNKAIRD